MYDHLLLAGRGWKLIGMAWLDCPCPLDWGSSVPASFPSSLGEAASVGWKLIGDGSSLRWHGLIRIASFQSRSGRVSRWQSPSCSPLGCRVSRCAVDVASFLSEAPAQVASATASQQSFRRKPQASPRGAAGLFVVPAPFARFPS